MPVITNIEKIEVGYDETHFKEWVDADSISWGDSDPWMALKYPGADRVTDFQHINPNLIEGVITCFDFDSFEFIFYKVPIQDPPKYAIEYAGRKNRIGYFRVYHKDSEGNLKKHDFTNVRIRNVSWPKLSLNPEEPHPFMINFYVEKVEPA